MLKKIVLLMTLLLLASCTEHKVSEVEEQSGNSEEKVSENKHSDIAYYLQNDRHGNPDFEDGLYQFFYYPEDREDLFKDSVPLYESQMVYIFRASLETSMKQLLDIETLSKDKAVFVWSRSDERDDKDEDFKDFNVQELGGRKVGVQTSIYGDKFYFFAERIDKNNVVLYTGVNVETDFYSNNKLKKIFKKMEKDRLSKLKKGDCYMHQGNLSCIMDDGKESLRFELENIETVDCELYSDYIYSCSDSFWGLGSEFRDLYFLKNKRLVTDKDFGYNYRNHETYDPRFFFQKVNGGVEVFFYDGGNNTAVDKIYDIKGNLLVERNITCAPESDTSKDEIKKCTYIETINGKIKKGKVDLDYNRRSGDRKYDLFFKDN